MPRNVLPPPGGCKAPALPPSPFPSGLTGHLRVCSIPMPLQLSSTSNLAHLGTGMGDEHTPGGGVWDGRAHRAARSGLPGLQKRVLLVHQLNGPPSRGQTQSPLITLPCPREQWSPALTAHYDCQGALNTPKPFPQTFRFN